MLKLLLRVAVELHVDTHPESELLLQVALRFCKIHELESEGTLLQVLLYRERERSNLLFQENSQDHKVLPFLALSFLLDSTHVHSLLIHLVQVLIGRREILELFHVLKHHLDQVELEIIVLEFSEPSFVLA